MSNFYIANQSYNQAKIGNYTADSPSRSISSAKQP
jgi:hypothetical protein